MWPKYCLFGKKLRLCLIEFPCFGFLLPLKLKINFYLNDKKLCPSIFFGKQETQKENLIKHGLNVYDTEIHRSLRNITSSRNREFSSLKWCSSNDISPNAVGPPQLGQEALPRASLYLILSARSLSFSVRSCVFSWRSCCVCKRIKLRS